MSIITNLETLVSRINTDTFKFYYGELAWNNLTNEDVIFPLVSVDFIRKLKIELKAGGALGERYHASIYFGYKSELDWTTIQHEEVILKAQAAARNFISNAQKFKDDNGNSIFDEVKFIDMDRVILRPSDDVGTSGILLQLEIVPNINAGVCI